jgi:hypothetical protein
MSCHSVQNLLLSFYKTKDYDLQNYISTIFFVWVWNFVSHLEDRTEFGGVWNKVLGRIFKKLILIIVLPNWLEVLVCDFSVELQCF